MFVACWTLTALASNHCLRLLHFAALCLFYKVFTLRIVYRMFSVCLLTQTESLLSNDQALFCLKQQFYLFTIQNKKLIGSVFVCVVLEKILHYIRLFFLSRDSFFCFF